MKRYYFTYGSEGHPYVGGWTEIVAPDEDTARRIFAALHPAEGVLRCCDVYDEDRFNGTRMFLNGNFGARCHEEDVCRVFEDA